MDRAAWSTGIALLFMAYVIMPGALLQDAGANTSEIPQRHGIPHGRVSQAAMACHTRGAEGALTGTKGVLKGPAHGTGPHKAAVGTKPATACIDVQASARCTRAVRTCVGEAF